MSFEEGSDTEFMSASSSEFEILLTRVADMIKNAKPVPLSSTVRIEKDEVLDLLNNVLTHLPEELRRARWMLKEREEFLEKVRREGDEILEAARARSARMVERSEIVREAELTAGRIVEKSREDARALRHESEDYCDQKLAAFEIVLERTLKTVIAGRQKLKGTPLPPVQDGESIFDPSAAQDAEVVDEDGIFDQDE